MDCVGVDFVHIEDGVGVRLKQLSLPDTNETFREVRQAAFHISQGMC
jgi:hypothetical protein